MTTIKQKPAQRRISTKPVLLVTGFGPFEQYGENPSGDIAKAVHRHTLAGVRVIGCRLDVGWRAAWTALQKAVKRYKPDALLCLGVAPDPFFRLEVIAKNCARACVDVFGEHPELFTRLCIVPDAPAAYWTTLPVEWLQERLKQRSYDRTQSDAPGIAAHAEPWPDAGWFLCNYVFYHVMHFLEGQIPCRGFVHVPPYAPAGSPGIPRQEVLDAGKFLVTELASWLATSLTSRRG